MGGRKLSLPFRFGTVLGAVVDACAAYPTVVVASRDIATFLAGSDATVLVNADPERGMAHSLRLANAAISAERPIAVLLGDKPLVTGELVEHTIDALEDGIDVVFPQRDGVPGHPVVLSSRARSFLDDLRDGDTLHVLRDDPRLVRRALSVDDDGAFEDIDTEADYRRLCAEPALSQR